MFCSTYSRQRFKNLPTRARRLYMVQGTALLPHRSGSPVRHVRSPSRGYPASCQRRLPDQPTERRCFVQNLGNAVRLSLHHRLSHWNYFDLRAEPILVHQSQFDFALVGSNKLRCGIESGLLEHQSRLLAARHQIGCSSKLSRAKALHCQ